MKTIKQRVSLIRSAARRGDFTAVYLQSDGLYRSLGVNRTCDLLDSLDKLNPWFPFEARSVYLIAKLQSQHLRVAALENTLRQRLKESEPQSTYCFSRGMGRNVNSFSLEGAA
ncbi:hypothetical protein [Vibrio hangzhouensis]|uniref:Uncharacterized protein n=1 Tax=Vibrio hangzhouensis TaxID=462991 RepID=A0A1H5YE85_9VIBR|nr:hypothetical protein [Vibrio hangzhouensis]SEG21746.1 hypothetical protein SAMN04488244_10917 [Vibrio hangzhouensis]